MTDGAQTVRRVVRRISAQDFERIVLPRLSRLTPLRIEAVRRVMVDGVRWRDAAAMPGVAMSALSKAVARGWQAVDAASPTDPARIEVLARPGLPQGWVALHLVAPETVLPQLKTLIEATAADLRREHARKMTALKESEMDCDIFAFSRGDVLTAAKDLLMEGTGERAFTAGRTYRVDSLRPMTDPPSVVVQDDQGLAHRLTWDDLCEYFGVLR